MKRLLKRIWYRIVYKRVEEKQKFCLGCIFQTKSSMFCREFNETYGNWCENKIFVKRFKL